MEITEHKQ